MKRSSTFGLRLFTSLFLILFTFAQPLLAIESLMPVQDAASTESVITDTEGDILDEGISDPEEIAKPTWMTSGESATTSSPVVVGEVYTYPINPAVTVTFSKLPTVSSSLTIKTIYLTDEQVKATNAASDVAYDITTDMVDGSFEYDLTLPKVGDNTKVIYAENVSGLTDAKDIKNVVENSNLLKIESLNHFTVFVVTTDVAPLTGPVCIAEGASSGSDCYNNIQDAITAATAGDTINVKAGTYEISSTIIVNKEVSIVGIGMPKIINTSTPSLSVFNITASNVTISGFELTVSGSFATAGTEVANAIIAIPGGLSLSNIAINNNNIHASYPSGTLQKDMYARGITVDNNAVTSLSITNNTISNVRNGVIVRNVNTANVSNNTIFNTKGGIMHYTSSFADAANRTMAGNSWTTVHNEWDIVWNSATYGFPNYEESLLDVSSANNNAYVVDLRRNPETVVANLTNNRSHVFVINTGVDKVHQTSGNMNEPFATLQYAQDIVTPGGTILLLSDINVSSRFNINKALTLDGNDHTVYSIFTKTDNSNNAAIAIAHDDVTLKNLTVDGVGSTDLHGINIYVAKNILLDNVTAQNNDRAGIVVNGSTVTVNNVTTSNNTWGGINVDQGSGVTEETRLTVQGISHHTEGTAIWIDDTTKDILITDTNSQYGHIDNGNLRIYFLDNTAPTVPVNGLPHNTTIPTNDFYFTWDASTDLSPITYEFQSSMNPAQVGGVLTTNVWHSPSPLPTPTIHSTGAPDGTWYWQVRAVDSFGNYSAWSTIWNVTLDTQAPAIPVLISPFDGAYVNGASVTNVWSDTSTDVAHYNYESYNDENLESLRWSQSFTTTSKTATNVADATFWWRVQAVDHAGNMSAWSDAWKVTVDSTKPVTQFTSELSGQSFNSGIVIEGMTTDTNGVHTVNLYYRISGTSEWMLITTLTGTDATPYNWSYIWVPDNNGTFDVRASGVDIAGNAEESPIMTGITYDTALPTIGNVNIIVDYLSQYVNGRTGFFMFVPVNDSLSGIDTTSCMYTLDGATWNNGEPVGNRCRFGVSSSQLFDNDGLEISAKVSDNAGNTVISNIVERKVDKALPTSQTIIDEIYYGPNSLPDIKGIATDTVSNVTNVALSLRRNSDGKYWIAGNLWMNISTPLHGTSGTDNWTYTQNLPTLRNNVTYTVTPYAWDQVHLATQAGTPDAFIWDNELPQDPNSFRAYPDANVPTNDNTVEIYFSGEGDNMSGVAGFYYSFSHEQETPDLTNWLSYEENHATSGALEDGIWWFNIRTIDNAGNITSTAHVGPFNIDTTAPEAPGIIAPTAGQYFNSTPILNDWTDATDVSGIASYRIEYAYDDGHTFSGAPYRTTTVSQRNHIPNSNEQGGVSFRVQAFDNAGNEGAWSSWVHYYYDITAPSKPIITNTTVFTNVNAITVNWTGGDDTAYVNSTGAGIAAYSIRYVFTPANGSPDINWTSGWVSSGNPHTRSGSFGHGEGKYVIYVKTVDMAGNESPESDSYTITYDKTAPDVQITAPTSTHLTGMVEVRGTVTDVNPHHYWFVITNSSGAQVAGLGTVNDTTSFTDKLLLNWDTTSLPEGNYTIKLEARDSANNKDSGSVQWLVVTVDHTQPTVDLQFNVNDHGFQAVFSEDVNPTDATNTANYFLNNWPTAGDTGDLVGDATITYDSLTQTATVTFTDGGWYISPEQQWGIENIHDLAGNILVVTPYTEYSTPMVAPVTTISGIDSLWHNTDVTVTLTCTDVDGSGCYKTYYSINGDTEQEGNTVVISTEGLNTITFYSEDMAGNVEAVQTSDEVKIDKTNPTADVLAALSFTTGDTTPRSLALSDNTELSQVCYVIDTNTQTCLPLFGTGYSWDITALINTLSVGTHIFTYYVEDTAGNRSDSNTIIEGNDPYAASVVVADIPAVQGAATQAPVFAAAVTPEEAVQGEQTTDEETTSPVTQEEVKGAQDTDEEETNGKPIPWWVYVLGGTALLSFLIFLIARRRKEEEEKEKNIR